VHVGNFARDQRTVGQRGDAQRDVDPLIDKVDVAILANPVLQA